MLTLDGLRLEQDGFTLSGDLVIPSGSRVAIVGPSGAGKSTLFNGIAGFIEPAAGRIVWDGLDLAGITPGARPVSILFQDNNLFPHLTIWQNTALGISTNLRLSDAQKEQVQAALERVGIADLGARKPGALSGGQQSRAALARVLLRGKSLVLLDEPFAALGPALKAEMLAMVAELTAASGATMLMVTHDPSDAIAIADQAVLVADGVASAPVETSVLFGDPPAALREYLGR